MTTSFNPASSNPAPVPFGRAETMHGLFEWCAERWPGRTALHHRGRAITYRELAETADAYAAELQARGVERGSIVPVLLPRSPELFATLLAVLKCGAAYAALDLRWPEDRLGELIEHLGGPLVAAERGARWPSVWSPPPDQPILGARLATVAVGADDACAVFFTSGTTGTPKGVVTAHRGNVRLFDDWLFTPLDSGAVMPQALAATWDAFGLDSWGVLFNGGTLVLLEDTLELATKLRDLVAIHGVTTIFPPTAVFHSMLDSDLGAFAGLRAVGTGGERLSARHAARFLEAYPDIPLYNMYGPVESSVAGDVPPRAARRRPRGAARRPAAQHPGVRPRRRPAVRHRRKRRDLPGRQRTGARVLQGRRADRGSSFRSPFRPGRSGSTARGTSGAGPPTGCCTSKAARTARSRSAATASSSTTSSRTPGACRGSALRGGAGDRRRRRVRGSLPGSTPGSGSAPAEDELRARLAERLPGYLVPALVQRLERLPVLEDRELDRRALTELAARLRTAGEPAPPETALSEPALSDTEATVARILREIIGVPSIATDVSFFRQGGNSLSAAQLCSRISRDLGVKLRISQVFEAPTVRGVAGLITAGKP